MGLFDIFKKKEEPEYDVTNLKLSDLKRGFMVDYDLKTWEVTAVYEYDWGDNCFTFEYQLTCADDVIYLTIEDDDEISYCVCKKLKPRVIDEDLPEYIIKHEEPPKKLVYNSKTYFKDSENPGFFRDIDETPRNKSAEFISWDYYDESEVYLLSVEQWGDKIFEAAEGKYVEAYEFSNILPANN